MQMKKKKQLKLMPIGRGSKSKREVGVSCALGSEV